MPPSGYAHREANAIAAFLRSCSSALEAEAKRDGLLCIVALERECRDIDALLATQAPSKPSIAVLDLTRAFYSDVASLLRESPDSSFVLCVEIALGKITQDILEIHVPPGLHLQIVKKLKDNLTV